MTIGILVSLFWLSGMVIMSPFFTMEKDLESLTVWMFLTLSVGSFIGGILADFFGRKPIFHICAVITTLGSFTMLISPYIGYIIAAGAIGPLNNLTFVLIM